jgi:hypothetical protein
MMTIEKVYKRRRSRRSQGKENRERSLEQSPSLRDTMTKEKRRKGKDFITQSMGFSLESKKKN